MYPVYPHIPLRCPLRTSEGRGCRERGGGVGRGEGCRESRERGCREGRGEGCAGLQGGGRAVG